MLPEAAFIVRGPKPAWEAGSGWADEDTVRVQL
jgi:hypothetical protein